MTSSTAIPSASSSTLSPHAAPFALPARSVRAPLQDGDVSKSMDGSIAMHREDKIPGDTCPVSSTTSCFRMKSCDIVLPASTCGVHSSQPSSWPEICSDAPYPSSVCSTAVVFSYPSVMMASNHNQKNPLYSGMGSNGSKCSTVKIERPPNKISETNKISCVLMSKSSITKYASKSNEDTVENASFPQILQVDRNGMSQDAMICSKEASPVSLMRPLHISTAGADPCDSAADGVKTEPSECSVDSPCWRGTSLSHLASVYDVLQTSTPQLINQESEAFGAGQKKSTSAVQHCEVPAALQNLNSIENKQNPSQSHVELSVPMKSGEKVYHKEFERTVQSAAKCTAEQKHGLELRDNSLKRSGLNFAAPDFIPSSIGKSKMIKGRNVSGILKAMKNLSEMLRNNYSFDEVELDEHEHTLLMSVIENLQTCLDKTRKGPIKDGASNKAGLKAHSQSAVLKSDVGNYKGSCTANGRKGITINKSVDPSHVLNDFGNDSLTLSQPSFNNIPRMISCEDDHSQILVYKNLWIDAERANCELKYLLKHNIMKIGQESSMAHIGGPRNPFSQACDLGAGPGNSCGPAISYPPTLNLPKGDPIEEILKARKNTDLLYTGDCIQLGDNSVLSCSESTNSHLIGPKNFQGDLLTVLEETGLHHHAHPALQLAPGRAHRELKISTMDEAPACSCFTGVDSILRSNSEYGLSSDWEHVLKEEIGWS